MAAWDPICKQPRDTSAPLLLKASLRRGTSEMARTTAVPKSVLLSVH